MAITCGPEFFAKFAKFAKFGNLVDRLRQQRERGTGEPRRGAGERSPSVDAIRSSDCAGIESARQLRGVVIGVSPEPG